MLIGLAGFARSGKDTAAKCLIDQGWTRVGLADAIKEAALVLNPILRTGWAGNEYRLADIVKERGWEGAKLEPEVRRLLQVMGTEVGRDMFGQTFWLDLAKKKFKVDTVISDVRFDNEFDFVKENGGIIIKVVRPWVVGMGNHSSEIGFEDDEVDYVIHNDGTVEELHGKVLEIVNQLRG